MTISEQNMREVEISTDYWSLVNRLERAGGERFSDGREGNLYHEASSYIQSKTDEINALKAHVNALRNALVAVSKQPDCLSFNCVRKVTEALSSIPEQCLYDIIKQARDNALDDLIAKMPKEHDVIEFNVKVLTSECLSGYMNAIEDTLIEIRKLKGK